MFAHPQGNRAQQEVGRHVAALALSLALECPGALDFGDGIGKGTRITNGEEITYTPMEQIIRYTNGYTTAFLNKYVKGESDAEHDEYLSTNQAPKGLILHQAGE